MRVAVIGGGINGYCCALQILEHFKANNNEIEVTIISEAFSPNTTGDGSAGLWGPYLLGNTPTSKIHKWSKAMHDFLEKIWLSEDAGEAGVCLLPVIRLTSTTRPVDDFWKDIVYGCMPLSEKLLAEYGERRNKKFTHGLHFVTYTSEPLKLLPYLMKRFKAQGGKVLQSKIGNLNEFIEDDKNTSYDVVINCTGLGARQMNDDKGMYPVRGQVARVKANWLYYCLLDESDDGNYIIPNSESVVFGGTHQVDDYNTEICEVDKKFIFNGCYQLIPALEHAKHLFDWVGLRPGRDNVRLEADKSGKKLVIHNYGHGGAGVTLAYGCAEEVLDILKIEMNKRKTVLSKL